MKKIILAGLAIWLLMFGMANMANATLISQNLFNSGDHLLTSDTATGLSWLNVPLTLNVSYNDVMSGFGKYITELGFRYATDDEVGRLFSDAGVVQGNIWGYWNFNNPHYTATFSLVSLLGVTYSFDGLWTGTLGLTGSTTLSPSGGSHDVACDYYNNHADSLAFQAYFPMNDSGTNTFVGSFLVREPASAPLPPTVWLLGSGLLGLVGFRKNFMR